jgi:hypothetical protein
MTMYPGLAGLFVGGTDWLYDLEKGCFFLDGRGRFGFGRVDLLLFLGMMGAVRGGKKLVINS